MTSYSAQLAYIHVEFYIHQLLHSLPELVDMPQNGPVTGIAVYASTILMINDQCIPSFL